MSQEIANLKRAFDYIGEQLAREKTVGSTLAKQVVELQEQLKTAKLDIQAARREREESLRRVRFLEELVDEFIDTLDGEPTGGDQLDHLLRQYGYEPTKGVPG